MKQASDTLLEALAVTAEVCGFPISAAAAKVMAMDLANYHELQVVGALVRVRREIKGRLTLADVLARIDDGRPGAEEAWAMMAVGEEATIVMTDEMAAAMETARRLDPIAGRMAFKETYVKLVQQSREMGREVRWFPSLGSDQSGRGEALADAVVKGRLQIGHAQIAAGGQIEALENALGLPAINGHRAKEVSDLARSLTRIAECEAAR